MSWKTTGYEVTVVMQIMIPEWVVKDIAKMYDPYTSKKIEAIKYLKQNTSVNGATVSLKDAKEIVEDIFAKEIRK